MNLFCVFLGGPLAEGRMGEDHEVVFVVAPDAQAARGLGRAKWSGEGRPHVDAVEKIRTVDGYRVAVTLSGVEGDELELEGDDD
jgi:hypothetical protein